MLCRAYDGVDWKTGPARDVAPDLSMLSASRAPDCCRAGACPAQQQCIPHADTSGSKFYHVVNRRYSNSLKEVCSAERPGVGPSGLPLCVCMCVCVCVCVFA